MHTVRVYVLILVFGAADVGLVLLHRVQFNVADGALVAFQCGSCRHIQTVRIWSYWLFLLIGISGFTQSDLVLWTGRTSPSVSAWWSVCDASCPRSAAGPSAGCWTMPDRWSRSGPGCCHRSHPSPVPRCSSPQLVSSSAELLPLPPPLPLLVSMFEKVLLNEDYIKFY